MDIRRIKTVCVTSMLLIGFYIGGCGDGGRERTLGLVLDRELGTTIGSLAEVVSLDLIGVEGYGVVGGLRGTGSAECPPNLRAYLEQYILKQLPESGMNVERFISSHDTAVVSVQGQMPGAVLKNQHFDVRVSALPGTQTTSLEGGWLYKAELKQAGRSGMATRVLAAAEGPVFIDTLGSGRTDKKAGFVLGGGTVLDEYPVSLVLRKPDFRIANAIRNRLNWRFGPNKAKAVSPRQIELNVPAQYGDRKQRFISIVKAMYLAETREINRERIKTFVGRLAVSEDKEASEIALEAIGNESLRKLSALLNSRYEEVRLRAARCMLNLGSDVGLETLVKIAMDKASAYRVEALEAVTTAARRNDAAAIARLLLQDEDFNIRLAAYEQLRKLDDIAVTRRPIARSFYLEQIAQTAHKAIFVSRSGKPRIVLFGAPIFCRDNIFVQSANGEITIDSRAGQKYVSLMRKHPTRPTMIGPLKSSLEVGDIIKTLCEELVRRTEEARSGLGVSYADMIALLKQMCEKGAIEAEFRAGPLLGID
ncbi:MAG TPA: flagellar basal body P-ring protein FlgI [Sedimentisphaerales bacterium]|nr:flagellar basal body P-ring protein FlgI [Sedimentisphaerales bacterium]